HPRDQAAGLDAVALLHGDLLDDACDRRTNIGVLHWEHAHRTGYSKLRASEHDAEHEDSRGSRERQAASLPPGASRATWRRRFAPAARIGIAARVRIGARVAGVIVKRPLAHETADAASQSRSHHSAEQCQPDR